MQSNRDGKTRRQRWRDLKAIGEFLAGVVLLLLVIVGGVMLPGFLTDSASTVGANTLCSAHR